MKEKRAETGKKDKGMVWWKTMGWPKKREFWEVMKEKGRDRRLLMKRKMEEEGKEKEKRVGKKRKKGKEKKWVDWKEKRQTNDKVFFFHFVLRKEKEKHDFYFF